MPIFKSRSEYRREVKRRFAKAMPPLLKYATPSHAGETPPALRQEIPLPSWIALLQEDRESVIKAAVRAKIQADLGPLPDPMPDSNHKPKPKPVVAPAPAREAEPEAEAEEPEPEIRTRYFTLCVGCGVPVGVRSRRPRFVHCGRRSCREHKRKRVNA